METDNGHTGAPPSPHQPAKRYAPLRCDECGEDTTGPVAIAHYQPAADHRPEAVPTRTLCVPCAVASPRGVWATEPDGRLGHKVTDPEEALASASWWSRACGHCGRPLLYSGGSFRLPEEDLSCVRGRFEGYCSPACRTKARNARRRASRALEPRACEECGEPFTPKRSDARYCSTRCRVSAHRRRSVDTPQRGPFAKLRDELASGGRF